MSSNQLLILNRIEQILTCLLAMMQKQQDIQKNVSILT